MDTTTLIIILLVVLLIWRRRLLRSRALVLIHEQSGAARGPELCIASPRKQLGSRSTPPGLSKPHAEDCVRTQHPCDAGEVNQYQPAVRGRPNGNSWRS
jgi:hypothetical protein